MILGNGTTLGVTPVELETTIPPEGTQVAFSGFPLSNVVPISATTSITGYFATGQHGTFTMMLDQTAWPGDLPPFFLPNETEKLGSK